MSAIDDLKQKAEELDTDGNGQVNYDDLKAEADKHGLGGQLDQIKGDITGPDGKVNVDDAENAFDNIGGQIGGDLNDLKAKF